jgi:hypothetical protein
MTDQRRKEKLSIHESSHAVIREILGGSVHYCSIYNADNPHVRVERSCSEEDEHVIVLSGIVGEFAFYPEDRSFNWGGDDWERAEAWSEDARREAAARAQALVREYRPAIAEVADKLLAELFITGEQVREAVQRHRKEQTA